MHNVYNFMEDICIWKWEAERTAIRGTKYKIFTFLMQWNITAMNQSYTVPAAIEFQNCGLLNDRTMKHGKIQFEFMSANVICLTITDKESYN
jgi:hypothetical protein